MNLKSSIRSAGGIYKRYSSFLEKLNIKTFEDFLYHAPSRYEDFSLISKISQAQPGEVVTIQGIVEEIKNEFTKNYKKIQKAKINDDSGSIEAVWFNQPFLIKAIHKGDKISLSGRISFNFNKITIESPEYEILAQYHAESFDKLRTSMGQRGIETIHTGRLVPIYPETRGISSKWIRRQVHRILKEHKIDEHFPDTIIKNNALIDINEAIEQIHFPDNLGNAQKAKYRLAFEELFFIQLAAKQRRSLWRENIKGFAFSIKKFEDKVEEFINSLPFKLTIAQKRTVREIFHDLETDKPMNRLLEGDVGSGKTVVSAIAMYLSFLNGFQSVLMAPTEILAQQHHKTISNLLEPFGVKVELVTGSKKIQAKNNSSSQFSIVSYQKNVGQCSVNQSEKTERQITDKPNSENRKLKTENRNCFDILVGTHAVLSEKIKFDKLGLVVIDEQQRFGVEQRGILRQKGKNPHLLTMTATPIPRTVALTMYGDLDLSVLDELPIGRKKIKTWLVPEEKRKAAYKWINDQLSRPEADQTLAETPQAFVVCPFIEESESMQTVKAATKEYDNLKKIFNNLRVGLLHGKLKTKEKDEVLLKFKNKEFDILVATPVVEVGIDIPDATIILIEAADRFGLAQLHQLRGRVGRNDKQSYCLLFTQSQNNDTQERLKAMEKIHFGAELAELDLKLRGHGELYGTRQHGIPKLKFASFSDFALIEKTKKEAEKIFRELEKYPLLLKKLGEMIEKNISPD